MRHLSLTFLLLISLSAVAQSERHSRVKVDLQDRPDGLHQLGALGIAVDHGDVRPGQWFITDLSETEIAIARAAGFSVIVEIEDVGAFYRERNLLAVDRDENGLRDVCNNELFYSVPDNFELGSMAGFYTWQEMLDILDAMHTQFPGLISAKESIGESHEGRPIHFMRISNNPNVDQDKPEVLFDALHHAREPASLSQLLFFMWYLLENYGTDAEATYLVDNLELYFVPCLNPDGYVYNETIAPDGGGMWRKNRRNNGDGSFGVDLNRNYGQGWGIDNNGSSPNPASDVYRGPAAFSEPETQAIRDFCEAHEFRLAQNHHTFGNLLIYPWGYQPSFYTPDSALYANYGALLTRENRFAFGTADQTVNYVVNGGSDDWMYGEQSTKPRIMAMTPESGKEEEGFWPPSSRITEICQAGMPLNLNTAHLAGSYAEVKDLSPYSVDPDGASIDFSITRLGLEPDDFTVSLEPLLNVAAVGDPLVFADMELLEVLTGSIPLLPALVGTTGEPLRFVLVVNNGAYNYRDTITKVIGPTAIPFTDAANDLSDWSSSSWGLSNSIWFSPPSSITDSPFGNYANNANTSITCTQTVDLADHPAARLTFMARWDIEPAYDYVQLQGRSAGGNWIPLCGLYTRPGSPFQDEGQPIYDGVRNTWVEEEIDLADFVGGTVQFRFILRSDNFSTGDGFYFDDFTVTATELIISGVADQEVSNFSIRPNPASDEVWIQWSGAWSSNGHVHVYNAMGALVREIPVRSDQHSLRIDTNDLGAGVYSCSLAGATRTESLGRLVVVKH